MAPHLLFQKSTCQLRVVLTWSEDQSLPYLQRIPGEASGLLNSKKSVGNAALDRAAKTDDAQRYVTYLMFGGLHSLILKYNLY